MAKKPSKLLSQQVYNKTELTAWEIKYSHRCIVVFTSLHTYPFSLGPSKSPTRILYALKTFDLHSVQNLQQQQQISYTELSNHDELQVNSLCLNTAHVSPG